MVLIRKVFNFSGPCVRALCWWPRLRLLIGGEPEDVQNTGTLPSGFAAVRLLPFPREWALFDNGQTLRRAWQ